MKQNTILISSGVLLIGLLGGYLLADKNDYQSGHMMNEVRENDTDSKYGFSDQVGYMDHSMMMVSSEREFLVGMIPHHQEAVDTAKEVLARGGTTEEMRTLANNIIIAQEKEILAMKQWYQNWYGEEYQDSEIYQPMMRDLSKLEGEELDKVFLEDMIMHHMGAIMMAQSVQPYIEHQEINDLSQAIGETQTQEIRLMRSLLNKL